MRIAATLLVLLVAPPALARSSTDHPHRDWGKVATLAMSPIEATACITRELAREWGRVTPVQVEGGGDIDGGPGGGLFGVANDPWVRWQVRTENGATVLRIGYRHPVSEKRIGKSVRKAQEGCLRVTNVRPAT